jgi:hypothetical protein
VLGKPKTRFYCTDIWYLLITVWQWGALINKLLSGRRHLSQWRKKGRQLGTKKKIAIISAHGHTKLKLTFFMLLGGPQNTIKSHLVFTALFCFAPFSVFFSRMSAPYCQKVSWQKINFTRD